MRTKIASTPEYRYVKNEKFELPTVQVAVDVKVDDGAVKNTDDIPF